MQILGAIALCCFAAITAYAFFKSISKLGHLRVSKFHEIVGIDVLTHTMSDAIGMTDNFSKDSLKFGQEYSNSRTTLKRLDQKSKSELQEI